MSTEWDEPRVELLTHLWLAGETARTIAAKLGRGVTRNAVIGKAHRLGLTGKQGSKPPPPRGRPKAAQGRKGPHREKPKRNRGAV